MRRQFFGVVTFLALCSAVVAAAGRGVLSVGAAPANPIKHVVIIFQENHSFDNVLGPLCVNVLQDRCNGRTVGLKHDGSQQPLSPAANLVPPVDHGTPAQLTAINGGAMNGFDLVGGCTATEGFNCYTAYQPPRPGNPGFIPNLVTLAENYVISDATFELSPIPSWGSHLSFAAAQLDGFVAGGNPGQGTDGSGPGWGCDSKKDAVWQKKPTSPTTLVPSCVPTPQGAGPYRPSPVKWVPTVFDRLQAAGLGFKLYTDDSTQSGYIWSVCPTFADCLLIQQRHSMVPASQILTDTAPGGSGLPALSVVLPNGLSNGQSAMTSQHNGTLMADGDNWIGQVVSAIQGDAKDWASTAIFITWDDCGCFYDHVRPPVGSGFGIRVPMVIVSPYAKGGKTDPTTASFASMLRFTEEAFSLPRSPAATPPPTTTP